MSPFQGYYCNKYNFLNTEKILKLTYTYSYLIKYF